MSEKWPRDLWLEAIWEDETLRPTERIVAYVYARYAFEGNTAWCSWDEVRRRTGIRSRDTVWRAITALTDAGWLTEVADARQHRSAVYRLSVPAEKPSAVRESDTSVVRQTDTTKLNGSAGVRDFVGQMSGSRNQQSESRMPELIRELTSENSHTLDRGLARSPSGARDAQVDDCPRCHGKRRIVISPGCMDDCPDCSPAGYQPYTNPPPGAYDSWVVAAANGSKER